MTDTTEPARPGGADDTVAPGGPGPSSTDPPGAPAAQAAEARDDDPVTVVIQRRVLPGRKDDYERWVSDVSRVAARFPGHQGLSVIRPSGGAVDEYVLVMRFATYEDLRRWETSDERRRYLERLEPLTVGESAWQEQTGLETWFTLPRRPVPTGPPPRWKMALLTTAALYPLLVAASLVVGDRLDPWPLVLRPAATTPVLVALMTWVVMPAVTRATYRWLYPDGDRAGAAADTQT